MSALRMERRTLLTFAEALDRHAAELLRIGKGMRRTMTRELVEGKAGHLGQLAVNMRDEHIASAASDAGKTWRCFHCDEVFTDEGEARNHFGDNDTEVSDEPGCLLNRGENELLERFRAVSREAAELRLQLQQAEYDCGAAVRADIGRRFKCAHTVQDAFNVYDEMEGRALAAEERLAAIEKKVPA